MCFFYQPVEDGIEIIRVLHGARDIEALFNPWMKIIPKRQLRRFWEIFHLEFAQALEATSALRCQWLREISSRFGIVS